ncbi:MAG: MotA/TolQ/ExbB proton channel family protein [Gammaproteobacteria bacterium]|nr:MotA/TolQ/ExbB proton channel family protein [Gammaproteobacteria bacterium]
MSSMLRLLVLSAAVLLVPHARADLEGLLREVQTQLDGEAVARTQRLSRFETDRSEGERRLRAVNAELEAERARVAALRTDIARTQTELDELAATLASRSGEVGGLFAAARQAGADLSIRLQNSLVSSQYGDRRAWLDALAAGSGPVNLGALKRLWLHLQAEILQASRVSRLRADVVQADGTVTNEQVLRLGSFNAVARDRLLSLAPDGTLLQVLPFERPAGIAALPFLLPDLPEGVDYLRLDPSRGQLAVIHANTPGLLERLAQGGIVAALILLVGSVGLLLGGYRYLWLRTVSWRISRQRRGLTRPRADNPLGRVLAAILEAAPDDAESALERAVIGEARTLRRGESLLKLLAAIAPLLGLLGTVTGMILTFQTISALGSTDPRLMAGGISQALITTALGLLVAIPLLLLHNVLSSRSRHLTEILEHQALGLLIMDSRVER